MHAHGPGTTAGINVGDYDLVRHGSADFAKNSRKVAWLSCSSTFQSGASATRRGCSFPGLVVVDDGSTVAGRFDQPGSSVTDVQGGEHDGQIGDEDGLYIVEQIDAASA
eukprot:1364371-Pleurochrysis_carterae.AAC.2